ncbi:hypothetical protein C8E95_6422 [Pseudonocardia autotrophica]|uniref:Uncharacterized protein n=2 Tax=Pseudonocardia TaxID=1847 RepID=A0A1Y2MGL1_PSEAH|nr:hypothetical protein BG845_06869 [Pseudonocardia autotrophica]OZM75478.1 hypothetical protein CFP66_46160 [Pseudonocardia sp. MH-G8]TDN77189.1 hypothetical protein C8E95_6422 [Pseudonocardia autotrophica]BBG01202.1 hypothetical protein Pdca_24110 [Pseudonocardia autotrophica]GEC29679.1 hypothetical protein PSA01_67080 [Pseudonocardia saturnea]
MSVLLLIRSVDLAEVSVEQASDYLVHHRRYGDDPDQCDTLLGIWIRRELDADLPTLFPCGERRQTCGCAVDDPPEERLPEVPVGIRTSSSVSGLWSLCWLGGPALREAHNPHQRRHRVLDFLVQGAAPAASLPGAFFPVFAHTDSDHTVNANQLRSRYPHLVATHWYIDDPEQGISGPCGTTSAGCRLLRGTATTRP